MGLGLGWLRVVAQGYKYSCSKIELGSNFQNNFKSWSEMGLRLGWLRAVAASGARPMARRKGI